MLNPVLDLRIFLMMELQDSEHAIIYGNEIPLGIVYEFGY